MAWESPAVALCEKLSDENQLWVFQNKLGERGGEVLAKRGSTKEGAKILFGGRRRRSLWRLRL